MLREIGEVFEISPNIWVETVTRKEDDHINCAFGNGECKVGMLNEYCQSMFRPDGLNVKFVLISGSICLN